MAVTMRLKSKVPTLNKKYQRAYEVQARKFLVKVGAETRDEIKKNIRPPKSAWQSNFWWATGSLKNSIKRSNIKRSSTEMSVVIDVRSGDSKNKMKAKIHTRGKTIISANKMIFRQNRNSGKYIRTNKVVIKPKPFVKKGIEKAERLIKRGMGDVVSGK